MIRHICKQCLGAALAQVDTFLLRRDSSYPGTPVFIVGPPRSGTTVIYQLLTHCLRTSYLCNFANQYFHAPIGATWAMRRGIRNYISDFKSTYGSTKGRGGPSQGDRIWARWMGNRRSYVGVSDVPVNTMIEMRGTIGHISRIMDAPFINKSIANSVRIPALSAVFPNALFLWTVRDLAQTVQSQLINRREALAKGNEEQRMWMSARPREYESIRGLPLVEQVCSQIHYLHKNIESDLRQFARGRYRVLRYEDVCVSPGTCVSVVEGFWQDGGTRVERRFDPPASFPISSSAKVDLPTYDQIVKIMREFGTLDGAGVAGPEPSGPAAGPRAAGIHLRMPDIVGEEPGDTPARRLSPEEG